MVSAVYTQLPAPSSAQHRQLRIIASEGQGRGAQAQHHSWLIQSGRRSQSTAGPCCAEQTEYDGELGERTASRDRKRKRRGEAKIVSVYKMDSTKLRVKNQRWLDQMGAGSNCYIIYLGGEHAQLSVCLPMCECMWLCCCARWNIIGDGGSTGWSTSQRCRSSRTAGGGQCCRRGGTGVS